MNDQYEGAANVCTTKAAEDLRARLAKYEDAEGRPIGQLSAFNAGVKAASDKVKSIVADYDEQHGSTDPDTGTREYPGNGEEWVGQMMELIEDFTGIACPKVWQSSAKAAQVMGRVYDGKAELNSIGRALPDHSPIYAAPASDVVPVPRELPPFAHKVIAKLKRFEECTDDGQGADIGRHWFDLLTQLGLLNRVQRSPGLWEITAQGEALLAAAPSAGSQEQE